MSKTIIEDSPVKKYSGKTLSRSGQYRLWRRIACRKMFTVKSPTSAVVLILLFILSVGVGYASYKIFTHFYYNETFVPKGAVAVTMCSKCKSTEERRCQDIKDISCNRCGEPLGYARQCVGCGCVFPYIPLTIDELPRTKAEFAKKNDERMKCPKCKSPASVPVLTEDEKGLESPPVVK